MKRFIVLIFDIRKSGWNVEMEPKAAYTFREGTYKHDVTTEEGAAKKAIELFKNEYWFINPKNYVVVPYKVGDDPRDEDKMAQKFKYMFEYK